MTRETRRSLSRLVLFAVCLAPAVVSAASPSRIALPDGSSLTQAYGRGETFGGNKCYAYQRLKASTKTGTPNVQWSLMDLTTGQVVDGSSDEPDSKGVKESDKRFFGASVSKVFVGAALLAQMKGKPTSEQLTKLKSMIVVSSNTAWHWVQRELGTQRRKQGLCSPSDSDENCGRQGVIEFTKKMRYDNTRGFQGSYRRVHGNELNAKDTNKFLADTYNKKYDGAEIMWNLMQGYRTGHAKARKYIPRDVAIGGKTGTYISTANNTLTFKGKDGHQYGMTILSQDGREETVALLAGGLVRQYTGIGEPCGASANPAQPQAQAGGTTTASTTR